MPYISENGQTRFVTQEEYVAWSRGQGLPTSPLRGGTANGDYRPPAGGTDLTVSRPVDTANLTSRQRRDLVLQQERQVDSELADVDSRLAQANRGQITLSPSEIAALEQRKSDLADASNQLASGQPVTSGVLEGGRTSESIIIPNTANNTAQANLPQEFESSSENLPVEDNTLPGSGVVDPPQTLGFSTTPVDDPFASEVNEQSFELITSPEDIPVEQSGDELIDLNTGEVLGIDEESGFVDRGGLLVAPEDLAGNDPFVPEDGLLEFTSEGDIVRQPEEVSETALYGTPFDDEGNLNPGWDLDGDGNPFYRGFSQGRVFIPEATGAQAAADRAGAEKARLQQTIAQQRKAPNNGDWRVKLRLAPQASYLYKSDAPGILRPLQVTDGIIFPYTPAIDTAYRANYSQYDLTHSNYRGYFYQNSYVDAINLRCTFTAQSTSEADYLLATIHFLKSLTKMFYGQDAQSGSPPPLVYLTGLGQYQFNEHPCLVQQFNYNLPNDVDYIRAGSNNINNTNLSLRRPKQTNFAGGLLGGFLGSAVDRLLNTGLPKGGVTAPPPSNSLSPSNAPTYVPTKMEIVISLLPIQSRQQVSKQFSVKQFANGDLLKGGFW